VELSAGHRLPKPPDGDYRNLEDEGFKVDNDENPMPKWVKDAKNPHPPDQRKLSTSWTAWPTTVIPT
jgi:hypothetical protein